MDGAERELNVSRRARSEHRPSELLLADLAAIRDLSRELGVVSDAADFDTGLTTDANPAEHRG